MLSDPDLFYLTRSCLKEDALQLLSEILDNPDSSGIYAAAVSISWTVELANTPETLRAALRQVDILCMIIPTLRSKRPFASRMDN
jgi:hypothetical protein